MSGTEKDAKRLDESRALWDDAAASFDDEPDHGLRDPAIRAAWADLLAALIPNPGAVLDIGCGTGSLNLVLAEQGHHVTGIDLSPAMIERARAKAAAASQEITFHVMDAAFPALPAGQFDALVCRHLLWTLPEPAQVLQRWAGLLRPGGRLVLIEGFWSTGVGLRASDVLPLLPPSFTNAVMQPLGDQAALWGGPVSDERYVIRADLGI